MKVFDSFSSWYEGCYADKAEVIPAARSFALLHDCHSRAREAVLFIHGYAGYPGELVSAAQAVYEKGFDCFVPRLPGMGTSGRDFMNTDRNDWLTFARSALVSLLEEYGSVSLVAHSMGCLIAFLLQADLPVRRAVLAMPAFSMPQLDRAELERLALSKPDIPAEWKSDPRYHLKYENAPCDDEKLGHEYYSHVYPRQLVSLLDLSDEVKKHSLRVPALILASRQDAVTDSSACSRYTADAEIVYFSGATHYIYYDIDPQCEADAVRMTADFLLS